MGKLEETPQAGSGGGYFKIAVIEGSQYGSGHVVQVSIRIQTVVDIDGTDVPIHADTKAAVRMLRVLAVVVGGQRLLKRAKGLYIIALGAITRSRRVRHLRVRAVPVLFSPAAETAVFPDHLR